jgi:tungstate transport system permease protein
VENFLPVVALSFGVSVSATLLASVAGISAAALLALSRFPGRGLLVVVVNALLGLPPVVVGLAMYLLLSHEGPLGPLGLLFTPAAMVLAQAILATPIVAALAHRVMEARWAEYGRAFEASGASRLHALPHLLAMSLRPLTTAVLAGFGRTISEVGAVLIVGGNIAFHTRTMTTTIVLETSRGNLELALSLGLVLIGISVTVSSVVLLLGGEQGR